MANFQTRILQLDLCVVMILLTYTDYSKSNQDKRIREHINKTVFVGETVTLHCNKTPFDEDFKWKMNSSVIFSYDSNNNRTMRNFSSNRIHINTAAPRELKTHQIQASDAGNYTCYPAAIRWILTITENRPASPKQMPLYPIIISCSGVIMFFLIITISFCIYRKLRQKISSGSQKEDVRMISHFDRHTMTACVSQFNMTPSYTSPSCLQSSYSFMNMIFPSRHQSCVSATHQMSISIQEDVCQSFSCVRTGLSQ